jgi:hypothetical protein
LLPAGPYISIGGFELFRARLAYKFAKRANMTPKYFPQIFSIYGYQKTQNLKPISNRLKSIKKVYTKKFRGLRTIVNSNTLFSTDLKSASNSAFFDIHRILVGYGRIQNIMHGAV